MDVEGARVLGVYRYRYKGGEHIQIGMQCDQSEKQKPRSRKEMEVLR